ncbi:unnamed protein product [Symbiodinium microadriaticum]|nr:unnamed protein product [Symbiodinium microadriaticum]
MSMFEDDLGQELQREEAVKPKSSLKPRRGSRRQSRRVSQAGVDAAVAAAVGEKSEATGDNIGKALSKITGQAKALKFAMDLAQKAYDARDEEEDDDFHVDCEESDEDDPDGQRQDSEVEKLRQRAKSEPAAKEELEMAELFTNLESDDSCCCSWSFDLWLSAVYARAQSEPVSDLWRWRSSASLWRRCWARRRVESLPKTWNASQTRSSKISMSPERGCATTSICCGDGGNASPT